jgi:hypothetical protein
MTRRRSAPRPVAEGVGLPPDEDAAGDGHLTRGMVFTRPVRWRQRVANPPGRRRGLQAQGPLGEGLVAIDLPADVHAGTAKSTLWPAPEVIVPGLVKFLRSAP